MIFVLMLPGMIQGEDFFTWLGADFISWITSLLRIPVLIALFGLTLWVIVEIGMATSEWLSRAGKFSKLKDLEAGLQEAKKLIGNSDNITTTNCNNGADVQALKERSTIKINEGRIEAIAVIKDCMSSKFVHMFLNSLSSTKNDESFPIRLQRLLQICDEEISKRIERTRMMVRIGPMLGLMGTLIPMGPALLALTEGDVNTLATNLIYAFGTTVLGLVVAGSAYVITTVRQRWYDRDINEIRYICEMLFGGD